MERERERERKRERDGERGREREGENQRAHVNTQHNVFNCFEMLIQIKARGKCVVHN